MHTGNLISDQSNTQKIVNYAYGSPLYYTVDNNYFKNYFPAKLYITEPLYLTQYSFRNSFGYHNINLFQNKCNIRISERSP